MTGGGIENQEELYEKKASLMIQYLDFEGLPPEPWLTGICRLHDSIFSGRKSGTLAAELASKPQCLTLVAVDGDKVVGYKIGYEERKNRFYSWLGGVHSEYRSCGTASELMRRQHQWCRLHGYTTVRTHTKNKWRDMLILDIRCGFEIIGTYTDGKGEPKIILEKRL